MYLSGACCNDCERSGLAGLGLVLPPELGGGDVYEPVYSGDLGSQTLQLIESLSGAIPVAGPFIQGALQLADQLETALHVGVGRNEADIIVHDNNSGQNLLMSMLGQVTEAIRVGQNPTVEQLRQMWSAVYAMGEVFKKFVLAPRFVDRRASGQALNTVMPYIDGSCGYSVPLGTSAKPSVFDCIGWGDGTVGGNGTNGMLGALQRAIYRLGGTLPYPQPTVGPGAVSTLTQIYPGIPQLPQSGILPPRPQQPYMQASIIPVGGGSNMLLPAVLGIGALLLFRR